MRLALPGCRLLIAGFAAEGLDVATLLTGPDIVHLGFVDQPRTLYESARVFVAPTRFAAGIPVKVIESSAHGVPVMATTLLARQLGWQAGRDIACAPADDPAAFAAALVALYTDADLWQRLRDNGLACVGQSFSRARFTETVASLLKLAATVSFS